MGPISSSTLKNTITERQANVNLKKKRNILSCTTISMYIKMYNTVLTCNSVVHMKMQTLIQLEKKNHVNKVEEKQRTNKEQMQRTRLETIPC